jgi:hypothetical protein
MTRPRGSSAPGGSGWQWGRRGAIALCVVAVVAIGAAACGSSSPPTTASSPLTAASILPFPAQLLGHNKNTSQTAHALGRVLTSVFALSPSKFRNSQAAIYGELSGPAVVVFAARWSSAAASSAASAAFDTGLAVGGAKGGGSTDAHSFPAGPHGGALECGARDPQRRAGNCLRVGRQGDVRRNDLHRRVGIKP